MDSARCKAFVVSVKRGSFTAAARELGYTTSGISQLVHALEDDLGFSLLNRKSRGVVITKEGELIYPLAEKLVKAEEALYEAAVNVSGVLVGKVTIASYNSIATLILPAIIKEFAENYPGIQIQLEEGTKHEIEEMISNGKADLAFATRLENPQYSWIPFMEDRMVAVLPKTHLYANQKYYPIDACREEDFIMPGSGDDADTLDLLRKYGIEPRVRYTTVENVTAMNMVSKGLGISIMNENITKNWTVDAVVVPLDPPNNITLGISLPSVELASPATRRFIQFVTERLTKRF